MKYKFFGKPNMLVREKKRKPFTTVFIQTPLLRFDEKGEYVTTDEKLAERMKRRFVYEQEEEEPKDGKEKKPGASGSAEEGQEEEVKFICRICGDGFSNKGKFMSHYRNNHPKER